jgi:ATP-dependent DNA helicase PIF1
MDTPVSVVTSKPILSEEQQRVYELYKKGNNLFVTGSGGTGKSMLIKHIYNDAMASNKNIKVCATTGRAAILLDCKASTIHSWSGIGLARGDALSIAMRVMENKKKKANWTCVDILIVDEVSMLSSKLFDILNHIGKATRKSSSPFGGIQVLFFGDFYQLPPVSSNKDGCEDPAESMFCFESKEWFSVFPRENHIILTKVFRQSCEIYANILNKLRVGVITKKGLSYLNQRVGLNTSELEIKPTKMFPVKRDVETINNDCLRMLDTEPCTFMLQRVDISELCVSSKQMQLYNKLQMTDIEREYDYLEKNINAEKRLELKNGAQVMCIVNLDMESDKPICNGSVGIVVDVLKDKGVIVKFSNGTQRLVGHHFWKSELNEAISVKQIPLILAWAITIHKSQGATLDCAEIDAGNNIFEAGQTYVALSRVKSLDGLYLSSFDLTKIKVNKKARTFYQSLCPANG